MDWNNIKTIFIFTFLILNIYLGIEVYEKVNPGFDELQNNTQSAKRLDEIQYDKKPPVVKEQLALVKGKSKVFTEKEINAQFQKENSNQEVKVTSGTIINATLKDPYDDLSHKSEDELKGQLQIFLEEYVPMSEDYQYWKHDKDRGLYIFRQEHKEVPIYFNEYITEENLTGLIEIATNEKGEITSYRQTYMTLEDQGDKQKLIKAKAALLVTNIPPGTKVKNIELVYFTLITDEEQFQVKVFVPSWHIVTEEEEFIVDATNSTVINLEPTEESEVE
ncbi:two-component system regulatory protein YycI [Pseudalkalibacillus decolorationis]|uniref:two-component system regulatory protein YycI n=1 Tax=Pseudalkalibacillus decolorationis TaxID=163879 RepID=UPI0021495B9D|nr:two-component system regulatory protein YycI [Pseudalkalibacillus decolorationis]